MAFYIIPPKGNLSLGKLELYTRRRLQFLINLTACRGNPVDIQDLVLSADTVETSDCLIEGSMKDAVSHFNLRLVCAGDPDMWSFFVHAESALFYWRVSCMNPEELRTALKPLIKYHAILKRMDPSAISTHHQEMAALVDHVTELMNWDTLIGCYAGHTTHSIMIPWYYVPSLVAQRLVALHRGYAVVGCSKLLDVLRAVFDKHLKGSMRCAQKRHESVVDKDERMNGMVQKLKDIYRLRLCRTSRVTECVRHDHIDALSEYFPPCMKHLHQQLRTKHRLRHHNRIAYTLFLKEVGLPVNEAIQFWREEYSLPPLVTSNSHSWSTDSRRYTYSVRHLYGLEGRRINYKSHGCCSIQNNDPTMESGGCPFKHFDEENLRNLLQSESVSAVTMETIGTLATGGNYSKACQTLHREKVTPLYSKYRKRGTCERWGENNLEESGRRSTNESKTGSINLNEQLECADGKFMEGIRYAEDENLPEQWERCIAKGANVQSICTNRKFAERNVDNQRVGFKGRKRLREFYVGCTCSIDLANENICTSDLDQKKVKGGKTFIATDVLCSVQSNGYESCWAHNKKFRTKSATDVQDCNQCDVELGGSHANVVKTVRSKRHYVSQPCAPSKPETNQMDNRHYTAEHGIHSPGKKALFQKPIDFYRSYRKLVEGLAQ